MADQSSKLRILVLGYVVRRPLGGGCWPTLQYALGMLRLGHDVYFLEDSEDWGACYDPIRHITDEDPTYGLAFAARAFEKNELGQRWAYHDAHKGEWHGPCAAKVKELCRTADVLINCSGINPIRPWLESIPRRVYIDTDPAFEQVRQLDDTFRRHRREQHNVFFTYGHNIPSGEAWVPDDGIPWQATRHPVVLDRWPVTPIRGDDPYTTVMLWDSYEPREHAEFRYGMKSESFAPYFDLPVTTGRREQMELAIGGPGVPKSRLRENGWRVINPLQPTQDPWTYQHYLQRSRGEFTVAKHGYVVSRCGWFSERSAHYLASGRPVVTQDTSFGTWLPTGEGLFAFNDPQSAARALDAIDSDLARHSAAARELAREYFDSDKVLSELLELATSTAHQG